MARRQRSQTAQAAQPKRSPTPPTDCSVAILPVQLLSRPPPLPPIAVPFPEADFEDCTFLLDADLLCNNLQHEAGAPHVNGRHANRLSSPSSDEDDVVFVSANVKKRKMSPSIAPASSKRPHLESSNLLDMKPTVCRFEVILPSGEVGDRLAALGSRPGEVLIERISRLAMIILPNREEESLIKSALEVYDEDDNLVITLPIVDTDGLPIEREPHRFTNGKWLESMVELAGGVVGESDGHILHISADIRAGATPQQELSSGERGRLALDLHLSFQLSLSMLGPLAPSTPPWLADHLHRLIRFCYPNDEVEEEMRSRKELNASLIYSLLPSSKLPALEEMQPIDLNPSLFPFQRKSVNFLLGREGKRYAGRDAEGRAIVEDLEGVMAHDGVQQLGLWWQQLDDGLYYNPLLGKLTSNVKDTRHDQIQGGILAEEMGLGKTVEVLALLLLNRGEHRTQLPYYYDAEHELEIAPTKTTLIVAPETLRQQWLDEIALHAPHLRTFSYVGHAEASKRLPQGVDWREYAREHDVMVVSFDTLRREINVARKAPSRSRRFERRYERPRSLLVQLSFHRVVMDEVQLVGHGSAAETVSLLHRHYSLAVSGTPVKMIGDLLSLFHFLRVLTPATTRHWARLQTTALLPSLASCFAVLATRHIKSQVRAEMTLPAQTRVLVPVTFTAIEAAFYRDIYARVLQGAGIDPSEYSSTRDMLHHLRSRYVGDISRLQHSLVSLRQACTHPQIAGSHARGANYSGSILATSNTIRSMDEVLTIMIEGTKADVALAWQQLVRRQINRVVLLLQDKTNEARLDIAKEMLAAVSEVIAEKAEGVKADLARAAYVGPLYRFSKSEVEASRGQGQEGPIGDEFAMISALPESSASQADREKEHDMAERRIHRNRHVTNLINRWRLFTEQLHRAKHFSGNTYFQMGEARKSVEEKQRLAMKKEVGAEDGEGAEKPSNAALPVSDSAEVVELKKKENEAYDRAEEVRQGLLKADRQVVEGALEQIDKSPAVDFDLNELLLDVEFGRGGIFTVDIFDRLDEVQDLLNAQTEVLAKWREEILQRIRKPVSRDVSEEDELDDQYQENLDAQSEAEVLTEMYRVLLAERDFIITGVRVEGSTSKPALFVELERHFQTQRRLEMLRAQNPDDESVLRNMENAPTKEQEEVMKLQLDHFRKLEREKDDLLKEDEGEEGIVADDQDLLMHSSTRRQKQREKEKARLNASLALETILRELRELQQNKDGEMEMTIVRMAVDKLRPVIAAQKVRCEKLKKEHLSFMAVYNARSSYFKHMQQLSDDVGDIVTANVRREIETLEREEVALKGRIEVAAGRLRYLSAIEEEEGEGEGDGEGQGGEKDGDRGASSRRTCFICTEPLVKAVIFNTCGHSTCENCFKSWTLKRGQCPMCKTKVLARDVYRVTYGADGKGKRRQVQVPQEEKRKRQQERYNVISQDLVQSMSVMPIRSALGSKLDLLTRHLLYIEQTKPGTKSIVFTAFGRGITLVGDALRLNNIQYVAVDHGGRVGGRLIDTFKYSPTVNVLLLHSEAQSSGLNLTCAENVFLLEPLVNHSIELQAIGRVHRIGQSKETTVYIYQVNDTVEERIVQLATTRGQSLVTRENCLSKDLKDSAEMVARTQEEKGTRMTARGREGEFVASIEEVFHCLFEDDVEQKDNARQEGPSSSQPASSSPVKKEDEERERMRKERLLAVERRQAMSAIERERERDLQGR